MARPSSASNASRLATSTTLIPDAAICRANSLPIPDEAPVTSAHGPNCPLSSNAFIVPFGAKTARAAGDECNFSFQFLSHCFLLFFNLTPFPFLLATTLHLFIVVHVDEFHD